MQTFKEKVLNIVKQIPCGSTITYKDVAKLAGNPLASRAVGSILSTNFDPEIPCHRVIGKNGKLIGYNRGIRNKLKLLRKEGVKI
ncbi:MAG: MGMT family protein [Candidatus Pacebacteria bacterium]|nr:MGMT family protein [Candidatus Paceibacterota bacterium]